MNFWRTFGIHTVSAIETILDKPSFTLEELLEEDEVLQECRSENAKLLSFLTLPSTLEKLFEYITVEPEATADSVRKFKYPFISCEILCCDVWSLCEAVYQQPALVDRLYGFLERPAPLNPALAAHVSKVAGSLLEKKPGATLLYLRERPGMVDHFVRHLASSAVMDLLLKIISCDEEGGGTLEWLCSNELISKLVGKFAPEHGSEVHEHAAHALADIIQVSVLNKSSPLMAQMESRQVVETLLGLMFQESRRSSALYHGLDVMTELVKRYVLDAYDAEGRLEDCPAALQVIVAQLPQLQRLLTAEGPAQLTTQGQRVPLGFTRLKVVQFCVPLFFTNRACVDTALAESELLGVILDLFFAYEWNNFLHQLVESLVGSLFDGSSPGLRRAAVAKFHLPRRLAAAAAASEARFAAGGLRAGNHAFVLLLGETLEEAAEADGELRELVGAEEGWAAFVEGPLKENKALQDMAGLDSDSERDSSGEGARENARAAMGFQFGGWQDTSASSSEEGEGGDSSEGADVDEAARRALDELRVLAMTAQKAHEEEGHAPQVVAGDKEVVVVVAEQVGAEEEEEGEEGGGDDDENKGGEEKAHVDEEEEGEDKKGGANADEDDEGATADDDADVDTKKKKIGAAKLERADTGLPTGLADRLSEVGNNYGTPPPPAHVGHEHDHE